MYLVGSRRQPSTSDDLLDFSGTITTINTAQLQVPQQPGRGYLLIQNITATDIFVGIGPAKATATISGGRVTGITVNNGGIGYVVAPRVVLLGGTVIGVTQNDPIVAKQFGFRAATAFATLTTGAVSAITVSDGGAGYQVAPLVYLENPAPDLGGGAFSPNATNGVGLAKYDALIFDGTMCPTSAIAMFGAAGGEAFTIKVGF